jgi:UDP-glucose 4-epimerase
MKILVTGSAGHLGEGLVRILRESSNDVVGLDVQGSQFTDRVGSITDPEFVKESMRGVDAVLHSATLHKPHIVTHSRREFVAANIVGTLHLLEEAASAGVTRFVYTSTTSVFGHAMRPSPGAPAAWVTENVVPVPRNIYGVTKKAAEDLCELIHRKLGLPCVVLRTSRFFPDEDDDAAIRQMYADDNVKVNEYLYRRVDLEDVVAAHLSALEHAATIGFGRYIVSATTPFSPSDLMDLRNDARGVLRRLFPDYEAEYARRGWKMFPSIDRVYVNLRAREELGWRPRHDYGSLLSRLRADEDTRSALARAVGFKGYHAGKLPEGRYPTE